MHQEAGREETRYHEHRYHEIAVTLYWRAVGYRVRPRPSHQVHQDHPHSKTEAPRSQAVIPPSLLDHPWIRVGVTFLDVDITGLYHRSVDYHDRQEEQHQVGDSQYDPVSGHGTVREVR